MYAEILFAHESKVFGRILLRSIRDKEHTDNFRVCLWETLICAREKFLQDSLPMIARSVHRNNNFLSDTRFDTIQYTRPWSFHCQRHSPGDGSHTSTNSMPRSRSAAGACCSLGRQSGYSACPSPSTDISPQEVTFVFEQSYQLAPLNLVLPRRQFLISSRRSTTWTSSCLGLPGSVRW